METSCHLIDAVQEHGLADTSQPNQNQALVWATLPLAPQGDVGLSEDLCTSAKLGWRRACTRAVWILDWVHTAKYSRFIRV